MKKSQIFILVILAFTAASAGVWMGQKTTQNTGPGLKPEVIQGAIYPKAKVLRDFDLINQKAVKVSKSDLLGKWSLVFVGYTHCPDVCPTTMSVMNQVSEIMMQQKMMQPDIIFLSIDPERDTVSVLNSYVAYFNKDFIGLTGSLEAVSQFSQQLNAVFRKAPGGVGSDQQVNAEVSDNNYLMDHSSALMLINPEGNLQSILTAPHTPGNIIESIIKSQVYFEALTK